jgi:hypothetical protein
MVMMQSLVVAWKSVTSHNDNLKAKASNHTLGGAFLHECSPVRVFEMVTMHFSDSTCSGPHY